MQTSASAASYGHGVFVGKSSMAISTFIEGASAILTVMERMWLQTTVVTVDLMRETDMLRMSKAEAITSATVKCRRKNLSTVKKLKRHQQEMDERPTYGADMGNYAVNRHGLLACVMHDKHTVC